MADDLGVFVVCEPLRRRREAPSFVHDEVLDIIVHAPQSVLCCPRTPGEPIEHDRQRASSLITEGLGDLWMPLEHGLQAVIVAVPVGADRQEVNDDASRRLQACQSRAPTSER